MTSALTGTWDLALGTPIVTLRVIYRFIVGPSGLTGEASSTDETVELEDIRLDPISGHATWRQRINKPMRLTLDFDVMVEGDRLSGHSRAGRLPRTRVTGHRSAA